MVLSGVQRGTTLDTVACTEGTRILDTGTDGISQDIYHAKLVSLPVVVTYTHVEIEDPDEFKFTSPIQLLCVLVQTVIDDTVIDLRISSSPLAEISYNGVFEFKYIPSS